jgi:RimJ/RimL family protein N-acetyltransferase
MTQSQRLETARLFLRPLVAGDFESFYTRLVCDPVVMAFYHAYAPSMTDTERRTRARKDFFDHFADGAARFGYICWAIIAKRGMAVGETPSMAEEPGDFLGWAGVLTPALEEATLGPELAYMIASPFHGQGLTTEAAHAVVVDAFPRYGLAALHAVVDMPNTASRRVAEKLGFSYQGPVHVYGSEDMVLYTLVKDVP